MKVFATIVFAMGILALAVTALMLDIASTNGGHDADIRGQKTAFAANSFSREQYIDYLLRTERHDDPELWRRIEAVKQLKTWPR